MLLSMRSATLRIPVCLVFVEVFASAGHCQTASQSDDSAIIENINARLAAAWKEYGLRPATPATEAEWCRRVYLDLIGRLPSVKELDAFTARPTRSKDQIRT
jgi:hypothetical protein